MVLVVAMPSAFGGDGTFDWSNVKVPPVDENVVHEPRNSVTFGNLSKSSQKSYVPTCCAQ